MFFLKLIFRDEGHLYARFSFYIQTIYCKCLLFQFLGCGIHIHIPILTGVQNGRIGQRKSSHILLKHFLFEALFPRWMSLVFQLLVLCSDYLYPKCFLSEFFSRGIHMHIPILTGVENGCINLQNNNQLLVKDVLFEALLPRWRSLVCQFPVLEFNYLC